MVVRISCASTEQRLTWIRAVAGDLLRGWLGAAGKGRSTAECVEARTDEKLRRWEALDNVRRAGIAR